MSRLRTHFTDVNAARLWLKGGYVQNRGWARLDWSQNGDRPGYPGLLTPQAGCNAAPLAASPPEETRLMWRETVVRYHHRCITRPQVRGQIPPVVNHRGDNHSNRYHRADDQKQIMR
jgi:hypothetical protein